MTPDFLNFFFFNFPTNLKKFSECLILAANPSSMILTTECGLFGCRNLRGELEERECLSLTDLMCTIAETIQFLILEGSRHSESSTMQKTQRKHQQN